MDDRTIRDLFERSEGPTNDTFVANLRDKLEQVLVDQQTGPNNGISSGPSATLPLERPDRPPMIRKGPRWHGEHRRAWLVTAAALLVTALVGALALHTSGTDGHHISPLTEVPNTVTESTPATTVAITTIPQPAPYSQHFDVDIPAASDTTAIRFDGQALLPPGIESSDTTQIKVAEADVLVFPTLSGTLTNNSSQAVSLQLTLQLSVASGGIVDCIINDLGCETSIIRRASTIVVQPGQTATLVTPTSPSRIGTSRDGITRLTAEIADGSIVTGAALVLTFDGTQATTLTFDRDGTLLRTCTTCGAG